MKTSFLPVRLLAAALIAATFLLPPAAANARGTARVQQPDGDVKYYTNVRIVVKDQALWFTSSDDKGTIVVGKAACTKIGELIRCYPYDATLYQDGRKMHIALQSGTVWLNPSGEKQQVPYSSTQLPSHGVMLAVQTKRGTYVSLNGTADEVLK
jgi:hypothetical protein